MPSRKPGVPSPKSISFCLGPKRSTSSSLVAVTRLFALPGMSASCICALRALGSRSFSTALPTKSLRACLSPTGFFWTGATCCSATGVGGGAGSANISFWSWTGSTGFTSCLSPARYFLPASSNLDKRPLGFSAGTGIWDLGSCAGTDGCSSNKLIWLSAGAGGVGDTLLPLHAWPILLKNCANLPLGFCSAGGFSCANRSICAPAGSAFLPVQASLNLSRNPRARSLRLGPSLGSSISRNLPSGPSPVCGSRLLSLPASLPAVSEPPSVFIPSKSLREPVNSFHLSLRSISPDSLPSTSSSFFSNFSVFCLSICFSFSSVALKSLVGVWPGWRERILCTSFFGLPMLSKSRICTNTS